MPDEFRRMVGVVDDDAVGDDAQPRRFQQELERVAHRVVAFIEGVIG
jgi:hypothetical protein